MFKQHAQLLNRVILRLVVGVAACAAKTRWALRVRTVSQNSINIRYSSIKGYVDPPITACLNSEIGHRQVGCLVDVVSVVIL